jgi:hypothetical protein
MHPRFGRAYALVTGPYAACTDAIRDECRATILKTPIIALAIFPSTTEALQPIRNALLGSGHPGGVLTCDPIADGLVVEWNLDRTSLGVVLGLIDIELNRFRAERVNALLSPLPLSWWTRIAAEGLRTPEIAPERVLEELLEESHVRP